jgi:hypothetical protein
MNRPRLFLISVIVLCAASAESANAAFTLQSSKKVAASKLFTVGGGQISTFEPTNLTRPIATIFSGMLLAERVQTTTVVHQSSAVPEHFELSQNFPNPFNMSTKIVYSVPVQSNVSIIVYDLLGRETAVLVNSQVSAGTHTVHFERNDIASGTYFYRLLAADKSGTVNVQLKKMILLK